MVCFFTWVTMCSMWRCNRISLRIMKTWSQNTCEEYRVGRGLKLYLKRAAYWSIIAWHVEEDILYHFHPAAFTEGQLVTLVNKSGRLIISDIGGWSWMTNAQPHLPLRLYVHLQIHRGGDSPESQHVQTNADGQRGCHHQSGVTSAASVSTSAYRSIFSPNMLQLWN